MDMVRGADDHGIHLAVHFAEELAVVAILLRFRKSGEGVGRATLVDVAQGHDVLARRRDGSSVAASAAAPITATPSFSLA